MISILAVRGVLDGRENFQLMRANHTGQLAGPGIGPVIDDMARRTIHHQGIHSNLNQTINRMGRGMALHQGTAILLSIGVNIDQTITRHLPTSLFDRLMISRLAFSTGL
jgi:hypothetical protein